MFTGFLSLMKIQRIKNKIIFFAIFLGVAGFLGVERAQAGNIYLESGSYLKNGQRYYELKVFSDTQGRKINVLAGEMRYAEKDLNFERTNSGGSIISHWVERPDQVKDGKIKFSGGIPGGLQSEKGYVFSAIFSRPENSTASQTEIILQNLSEYLSDGKGTQNNLADYKFILYFAGTETENFSADIEPPEVFAPYVYFDYYIEGGKWVVFFNAQDKGWGIDYYEIYESQIKYDMDELKNLDSLDWKFSDGLRAYVLGDQNLTSYIYIKAVDKAGNIRLAEVLPARNAFFSYKIWILFLMLFLLFAIVIFYIFFILGKRKDGKDKKEENRAENKKF